jgi:hypothetical protein
MDYFKEEIMRELIPSSTHQFESQSEKTGFFYAQKFSHLYELEARNHFVLKSELQALIYAGGQLKAQIYIR